MVRVTGDAHRGRAGGEQDPGIPDKADGAVLGRLGSLEVRLARSEREVRSAQRLRYEVFYEEMAATPTQKTRLIRRDADEFDPLCDHVLVIDCGADGDGPDGANDGAAPRTVGTCRLLRQEIAQVHGGFYSSAEFEVGDLVARKAPLRFLELGRSCVLKPYRNKRTIELLWHAVWRYALMHGLDVMTGCASLEGTDPDRLTVPLSFLHHSAAAPPEWRVRAVAERYVEMNRLPPEEIDPRAALRSLPPIIKGYLRLGAYVGHGAVVDHQFGTTDVLIVLPVSRISERYIAHFGPDAGRHG